MLRRYVLLLAALALSVPARADLLPKKASEIVHLYSADQPCPILANAAGIGTVITPAGTTAPFAVPKKKVFVVRRVYAITTNQVPGDDGLFSVIAGPSLGNAASYATHRVEVGAHGTIYEEFDFPLGLVVPEGGSLCVYNTGGIPIGGEAEGFLAPAK